MLASCIIDEAQRFVAIRQISEQAGGLLIGYLSKDDEEEQTVVGPIRGRMSVNEALSVAIAGTELRIRWVDNNIVSVEPAYITSAYADMSKCRCSFGLPELWPLRSEHITVEGTRLPSLDDKVEAVVFVGEDEHGPAGGGGRCIDRTCASLDSKFDFECLACDPRRIERAVKPVDGPERRDRDRRRRPKARALRDRGPHLDPQGARRTRFLLRSLHVRVPRIVERPSVHKGLRVGSRVHFRAEVYGDLSGDPVACIAAAAAALAAIAVYVIAVPLIGLDITPELARQLGLERALDFVEGSAVKPAHQVPPRSAGLLELITGEVRKAIASSTQHPPRQQRKP